MLRIIMAPVVNNKAWVNDSLAYLRLTEARPPIKISYVMPASHTAKLPIFDLSELYIRYAGMTQIECRTYSPKADPENRVVPCTGEKHCVISTFSHLCVWGGNE